MQDDDEGVSPHPSRCGSTPCPQFGIVVFEQSIAQILVASLSLRPPYSATGRGGTPAPVWEKAFIVVHYARNLAVLSNYRHPLRPIPASKHAPRGTPILIGAGWRSQAIGEK